MAKYYVQSGSVQLILQASSPRKAAVAAFQWSCERQATIDADSPLEHVQIAERLGWQLEEVIAVGERGFDQTGRSGVRHAGHRGGMAGRRRSLGQLQLIP